MISRDRIERFLTAYGGALAGFDAEGSAELWEVPGALVGSAGVAVVDDRAAMAEGLRAGYPLYQRLGLAGVDHEILAIEPLTDDLVSVRARWIFRDARGDELTDSTYVYVLREDGGALRTAVAISIDAEEKLAALAADHGVEF